MLNLNSLYNAVFHPNFRKFNPRADAYTVLMDTPAFEPLYPGVLSNLESWMNPDAYTFLHAKSGDDLRRERVEERLSQIAEMLDQRYFDEPPARRFCLFAYFDDSHRETGEIFDLLERIGADGRDSRDSVALMVCLSGRMEGVRPFLEEFSQKLAQKTSGGLDLYLFSDGHTAYYRRSLICSLCGAVVMNVGLDRIRAHESRKSAARSAVNRYVASQLGEQGQEWIKTLPPLAWSTLYCRYYDRQYDFLCRFVSDACKGLKSLENADFFRIVEEIYAAEIPDRDKNEVCERLVQAVSLIPSLSDHTPKGSVYSLEGYFQSLWGDRAKSAVYMTLKATLSAIYNDQLENSMRRCCEILFERCSQFAQEKLYDRVCELLEAYLASLRTAGQGAARGLDAALSADTTPESWKDVLKEYTEKYLQLYLLQKKESFWNLALRQIRAYPQDYEPVCRKAGDYHRQIRELTDGLPAFGEGAEKVCPREFTAGEILTLDQNSEICEMIFRLFQNGKDFGQTLSYPENCRPVFTLPLDPQFYQSGQVELSTDSYTLCGREINGLYLVHIGG